MGKTSSDRLVPIDLHVRMSDNTVLLVRKFDRSADTAIVLLPGFGGSISHYAAIAQSLSPYTVYLMELRGHGLSEGKWTVDKQRQDIAEFIQLLHFKKIIIVAHGITASIAEHTDAILVSPTGGKRVLSFGFCRKHPRLSQELQSVKFKTHGLVLSNQHGTIVLPWLEQQIVERKSYETIPYVHAIREAIALQSNIMMPRPMKQPRLRNGIAG